MERSRSDLDKRLGRIKAGLPWLLLGLCAFSMFDLTSHIGTMQDLRSSAHQPSELVQALIGFVVGCYGTLVGIGGGPVIVPILIFFYGWPSQEIVASSLFLVFLNAFSGSCGYALQGRIDYRGGALFALAAMPGAVLSTLFHHAFSFSGFNIIFGLFLLALGFYALARIDRVDIVRPAGERTPGRRVLIEDQMGTRYEFYSNDRAGIALNVLLGFGCGFLGIGGGVFQLPILVFVLGYPAHIAAATSHFVTLQTCAFALAPSVFLGHIQYDKLGWLAAGVLIGAQIGARLAAKLRSKTLIGLFVIVLLVFAARLIFSA